MRIAITGSTGLIGSAVAQYFRSLGCDITRVCRSTSNIQTDDTIVHWDIPSGNIDASALEGHDAVIHLAGANIAAQRWSPRYKAEILNSRIKGAQLLCKALAGLSNPPKTIISASAVGFYGQRAPLDCVDESTSVGSGFLSQVCDQWEKATEPAAASGIRVVHMRLGMVVSAKGGALAKMLPVFKLGFGGRIGSGQQMMSWIALDEIPRTIKHLIDTENISGAVNFVSPQAVSNADFTKILGKVIHRWTIFPLPSVVVKLLFGERGKTLLLGGQWVLPKKLLESGYVFKYRGLRKTLIACLK